jgi:cytochrome c oxidase assembly protein Cox11
VEAEEVGSDRPAHLQPLFKKTETFCLVQTSIEKSAHLQMAVEEM